MAVLLIFYAVNSVDTTLILPRTFTMFQNLHATLFSWGEGWGWGGVGVGVGGEVGKGLVEVSFCILISVVAIAPSSNTFPFNIQNF